MTRVRFPLLPFAMLLALSHGCSNASEVTCGKGTVLKAGVCEIVNASPGTTPGVAAPRRAPPATPAGRDAKPPAPAVPAPRAWSFDSMHDDMRGKDVYLARIVSTNAVEFPFPYNGGSLLAIVLRKGEPGSGFGFDAMLGISKGQFDCSSFDGCSISLKFDDGKVERWYMASAEGLDTTMIFFRNPSGLLAKLKKARKLIVEPRFTHGARVQFTFDIPPIDGWEGLETSKK